jgi:membrane-bound metal-dependent hydrolase YbcI (DUF457 family)
MPDLKQHVALGAGAGIVTYAVMSHYYKRQFDLGEMLVCAAFGTAAALVPDIIEPALSPNHRSFAHSLAAGCGLIRLAVDQCGAENQDWDQWHKILWAVATAGYLSHLVADGCTPRGLPLLCN